MKTLFLITKAYPFGEYEQYITTELQYIHKLFNKIIIYPNDYYEPDKPHKVMLPPNAEVINFNQTLPKKANNTLSDYLYLLKVTCQEFLSTDDKKNFFRYFKWNISHFWTQYQLSRHFGEYLDANKYNSGNSIFYSYWFHKSAIMLSILKDKKKIEHFVCRSHSIELYHNDWTIANDYHKVPSFKMFKLRHAPRILTVSRHGYNYLNKKYPQYGRKIDFLYLGVKEPAARNTSPGASPFHIVTCSTVDENKRIHLLAEALTRIEHPVQWTHFGDGPEKYWNLIRKHTDQASPNLSTSFRGSVPNSEVMDFYKSNRVDLFVNLSIVEGLPVSIMEALSYGIPILATAVYGTPEAINENENGYLLDVNFKIEELIGKLSFLMENKNVLEKMREASLKIYQERFHAGKNYARLANELLNA